MSSAPFSVADTHRFAGSYAIDDGGGGIVRLEARGLFLHAHCEPDPRGERFGLGMAFNGRLAVAYGPHDKVEIGVYRVDGPRLHGLWVPPGAAGDDCAGCGIEENSSHVGGTDGVLMIERAVAIDGSSYEGTLAVTPMAGPSRDAPHPRPVTLEWKLNDGEYTSFGIAFPDAIYTTFSFEPERPYAVAVYQPVADGALRGVILYKGATSFAPETLRRQSPS
jgi:hypothetical protein